MELLLNAVVNIAHPAFVVVGSYVTYMVNSTLGLDPVLSGLIFAPIFFIVGLVIYRIYYACFERTGQEALSGLAFFFGLMFIIEVLLLMVYGVDYRLVAAPYSTCREPLPGGRFSRSRRIASRCA